MSLHCAGTSALTARLCPLVLLSLLASVALTGCTTAEPSSEGLTATEVIDYEPEMPSGDAIDGSCFSMSMAVVRPGTYRCTVDSSIHDPCFGVDGDDSMVICGANPALGETGFTVKVAEALPMEDIQAEHGHAWLLVLADENETLCEYNSGGTGGYEGERLNYGCVDGSWIVGEPEPGDVWTARRVVLADDMSAVAEPASVEVRMVWR